MRLWQQYLNADLNKTVQACQKAPRFMFLPIWRHQTLHRLQTYVSVCSGRKQERLISLDIGTLENCKTRKIILLGRASHSRQSKKEDGVPQNLGRYGFKLFYTHLKKSLDMGLNLFEGGSAGERFFLFPLRGESYAKKRPGSDHPKYPGLPLINHGSPRSQTWVF